MPEVIKGRGGESRERGILGAGGESRAAGRIAGSGGESRAVGANHAKKAFFHIRLLFFVNIRTIKTKKSAHSCPPGQRATGAVTYSDHPVLHSWLNLSILIEEIPILLIMY